MIIYDNVCFYEKPVFLLDETEPCPCLQGNLDDHMCKFHTKSHSDKVRDHRQIPLLILNEFRQISKFLFPMKLSENPWFSADFRGNKS